MTRLKNNPVFQMCSLDSIEPPDLDMGAIYKRLEDLTPETVDLAPHFSSETLQAMPDIEQTRYRSIKLNYLVMREFGQL